MKYFDIYLLKNQFMSVIDIIKLNKKSFYRLSIYSQILVGLIGLFAGVYGGITLNSAKENLKSLRNSLNESKESINIQTESFLELDPILLKLENSIDDHIVLLNKVETTSLKAAHNIKEFRQIVVDFSLVGQQISEVSLNMSKSLPIKLPHKLKIKTDSFSIPYPTGVRTCKKWGVRYPCDLKWGEIHRRYPSNLEIEDRYIMNKEKSTLENASKVLHKTSSTLNNTSQMLTQVSENIELDLVNSLKSTKISLEESKNYISNLRNEEIPELKITAQTQINKIENFINFLKSLNSFIIPMIIVIVTIPLGITINGFILLSNFRNQDNLLLYNKHIKLTNESDT